MKTWAGLLFGLTALAPSVPALDFISTARAAILYDAPSPAAEKIAVVSKDYPLERIVTAAGWIKVRDESGSLLWIEESAIGQRRTARVSAPIALILEKPQDNAPTRFRAAQGVTLEVLAMEASGWARVRHAGGQEGYLRGRDAWGL